MSGLTLLVKSEFDSSCSSQANLDFRSYNSSLNFLTMDPVAQAGQKHGRLQIEWGEGSMKRSLRSEIIVFLICTGLSFGSSYSRTSTIQHQFHLSPKLRAQASLGNEEVATAPRFVRGSKKQQLARERRALAASKLQTRNSLKAQRYANPPTSKLGFVSATQIPDGSFETWGDAAIGDFNGDGKPDVVRIIYTVSISVVLENGDGTFKAPVITPMGDSCYELAVGDLNGDKKDDLLVVHLPGNDCTNKSSTFDVLISNGDGSFTRQNTYTISPNTVSGGTLAVTTKSGFLDVVAVDAPDDGSPSNVITIFGNGDGTFSTSPTSVALSGHAAGAAMEDVNGDGLLDVVGFDASGQVTVFLATSATSYAAGVPYTTPCGGSNFHTLVFGDLTNDGKPEIVNPNSTGSIAVYVNNGDGSFQPAVCYAPVLSGPNGAPGIAKSQAVAVGDVDDDGNVDVISSNASGDVTILLGNGDGTLNVPTFGYALGGGTSETPCTNCTSYFGAVVADFDGDGFLDIIAHDTEFSLAFLKGYHDGTFRAAPSYYAPGALGSYAYAEGIASGDFNGDGIPDIVIAAGGDSSIAGITVFLSGGDGSLKPGVTYGTSNCYLYVVVADFNKDGQPDLAANNACTEEVQIFTGKANGTFVPGPVIGTGSSDIYQGGEMVVGDFDGDGYPDIAVINVADASTSNSSVGVILNDGTGNFKPAMTYALSNYSFAGMAVGDLNGDGKLDLVVPYNWSSSVALLLGVGDGTFTQPPDVALGTPGIDQCPGMYAGQFCPAAVTLADIDGDGNMDIIAALDSSGGQDIAILPGTGTAGGVPSFGTPIYLASSLQDYTYVVGPGPKGIQALDIDGDGNLDLVYANSWYGTVGVLYGAGNGKFYDPVEYPVDAGPWRFAVADINNDGAKDVVVSNSVFNGVTALLSMAKANYAVTADSNAQTVTAGGTANFALTIAPSKNYNGTITFSCSGLPDKSSCTFSPTSLVMDGHTPMTVQWSIATTATTTTIAKLRRMTSILLATSLSGMGLFGMLVIGSLPKRRRVQGIILVFLIAVIMVALVGCGGTSNTPRTITNPGTPAGTYTVTLTATGTAGSYGGDTSGHVMTVALTVQ